MGDTSIFSTVMRQRQPRASIPQAASGMHGAYGGLLSGNNPGPGDARANPGSGNVGGGKPQGGGAPPGGTSPSGMFDLESYLQQVKLRGPYFFLGGSPQGGR